MRYRLWKPTLCGLKRKMHIGKDRLQFALSRSLFSLPAFAINCAMLNGSFIC